MVGVWAGPPAMMTIFRKMFGSHSCPAIIRQNNFSNFQNYFLLKVTNILHYMDLIINTVFVLLRNPSTLPDAFPSSKNKDPLPLK